MDNRYINENRKSRERLQKMVNGISDEELQLVIYKEGWTVAAALGHVAFWDERRAVQTRQWKETGIEETGLNMFDTHVVNDALLPFLLALPPRKAAELVLACAVTVDKELESLSTEMVSKIEALGDHYSFDRAKHRNQHLDEIDVLLKAERDRH
jgi:hypothetical protein